MMELAKKLDQYEKSISAGKRAGLMGAIQIGMALEAIRSGNLWLHTGAKSFEKWAAAAHGFGRSSCYNLISVATKFGKYILADASLQSIEPTRLIRLLPHVQELEGQSNVEDLLHQAAQIPGAQAFDDTLRNMAGKVATDECSHWDKTNELTTWEPWLERCSVCHKTRKYVP
jgi:hypothetical protein